MNQVDPVAAPIEGGYRHLLEEGQIIGLPLKIVLLMQVDKIGVSSLFRRVPLFRPVT